MTDLELAYKFNVSETAIRDVRKKHGIKKEPSLGHVSFAEKKVEAFLNELGVEFVSHQKLGRYIPDFHIKNTKIIIEFIIMQAQKAGNILTALLKYHSLTDLLPIDIAAKKPHSTNKMGTPRTK